jgi:Sigma-70, region 4
MDELEFERRIRALVSEPEPWAAVLTLSVQQRAVIVLTYWQDLAPRQVAGRLGISESSARRDLARGRERLRRIFALDELGFERRIRDLVHELVGSAPAPSPFGLSGTDSDRIEASDALGQTVTPLSGDAGVDPRPGAP